jgi:hypothetical protein
MKHIVGVLAATAKKRENYCSQFVRRIAKQPRVGVADTLLPHPWHRTLVAKESIDSELDVSASHFKGSQIGALVGEAHVA